MSNHEADAVADQGLRTSRGARRLRARAVVVSSALFLGLGGLAGCGDDDDASDTVPGGTADSAASSAPADAPTTTARASATTASSSSTTSGPSTTAAAATATESSAPAEATAAPDSVAAADTTTAGTAEATQPAASATSVDGTAPAGSEPVGTATETSGPITSVGPTTTGPECTFTDNEEFPLVRCDAGPPIAALQSVLQVLEYEIGTVDCLFGDQTHYAVRAFQTDQELTVTGEVDDATWAVLEESFLPDWGTDTNGNGTIEPSEITLTCA